MNSRFSNPAWILGGIVLAGIFIGVGTFWMKEEAAVARLRANIEARIEAARRSAAEGDPDRAIRLLEEALALAGGEPELEPLREKVLRVRREISGREEPR